VIKRDHPFTATAKIGRWFVAELECLQARRPTVLGNARGRGLAWAIDLLDATIRSRARDLLLAESVIALGCGARWVASAPPCP